MGGPDGVVVDCAANDGQFGVVVFDGDGHTEFRGQVSRLPQGDPLGGELFSQTVSGVPRPYPLAGVADHHIRANTVCEPDAGLQDVALDVVGGQIHEVYLERGVDRVGQVRFQQ